MEKAGSLVPFPQYGFARGSVKVGWGLTTDLKKSLGFFKGQYEEVSPGQILPKIHVERNGYSYDWDTSTLLDCMRMLQNKPFQKIIVSRFKDEPVPIAFSRPDCDISVLLAPLVFKITPESPKMPSQKNYQGSPWTDKGGAEWKLVSTMPSSTFQLWEFDLTSVNPPFKPDSILGVTWGYPIAKLLKCSKCGNESTIQDWVNRKIQMNHPECMCSCDTYDDFCGCRRNRESLQYDRLWHQVRQKLHYIRRSHWDIS